jgi:hypothetical protein
MHYSVVAALAAVRAVIVDRQCGPWVSVEFNPRNSGFRVVVRGGLISKNEEYDHATFAALAEVMESALGPDFLEWAFSAHSAAGRLYCNFD